MDSHTTQLASGPYEVQTRLTQIAQAAMPSGLIADEVCPRVRTGYKFTYTTLSEEDLLTIPDCQSAFNIDPRSACKIGRLYTMITIDRPQPPC